MTNIAWITDISPETYASSFSNRHGISRNHLGETLNK